MCSVTDFVAFVGLNVKKVNWFNNGLLQGRTYTAFFECRDLVGHTACLQTLYKGQMLLIKSDASTILKFVYLSSSKVQTELQCGKFLLCGSGASSFIVCRAMDSSPCWPYWTGGTIPSETDICCLPRKREALVWILWLRQPNWQDFASKESKGGCLGG